MNKKSVLIVLLMLSAMLSACNFPLAFGDPQEVENAVAQTLEAIEQAEQEQVAPPLPLAPTSTPMPTEEPETEEVATVTAQPEVKPTAIPLCLSATAYDLTVPDDTVIAAGAKFDKAWTFKNVGYCDWTSDFKLVFKKGDQMSGPNSKEIGVKVAPNGKVDFNLVLYAPAKAGTYRGNWMLQSTSGVDIGPVWVQIVVK
jgi:hypothetical protein